MDSVIFQAMTVELNRKLVNSRLDRVIQITAGSLILRFWTGREKIQLLLKADGQGSFYQTRQTHSAPARPPRFCQLLRARLRRLIAVHAEPLDRIVHFAFTDANHERCDLILEGFGAQGNLILVDASGRIIDLLWRQQGSRTLLPGEPYVLPGQKQRISLFADREELLPVLSAAVNEKDMARLDIAPMSPPLARAICMEQGAGHTLDIVLDKVQETFSSGSFEALRVTWDGQSGMMPMALGLHGFDHVDVFEDLSAMLEATQAEEGHESPRDLTARLANLIIKQRKKLIKRLDNVAAESVRQADPEGMRIKGDLLLAHLRQIKRGAESVEVDDYYQSPVVKMKIFLDTRLSPQENAERYFKLYRKARRAADHHQRRLHETEQEITWLDQVELSLQEAEGGDDLYQIQLELEAAGLLKQTKGQLGRRQTVAPEDQLHRAETPAGLRLFWGKNSRTNDYVSRRLTGHGDLWLHAHRMPGCHLVLKCEGQVGQVTEEDILFAASIAAGYSKGKDAGKVEVIVAHGRDVKKPKGVRPGLVTVDAYRTVVVAPKRLSE
ncbi:MAG: Rqc2 family fibronectin-binding protein [Desulfuromonadales bacterium]